MTNKRRTIWIAAALVAVAVVAPLAALAAADDEPVGASSASSDVDLRLLVLVNRLALDDEQMLQLHESLLEVASARDAAKASAEALRESFESEMIAFDGTTEELDALLVEHREALEALRLDLEATGEDAIETIKTTLTFEQGELLLDAVPLLDGKPARPMPRMMQRGDRGGPMGFGRTDGEDSGPDRMGFAGRGPMAQRAERRDAFAERRKAMAMRMHAGFEKPDQDQERPGLLESLIEVLELKMQ